MDERILSLVLKYEDNTITESEFEELSEWVNGNVDNKTEVVELLGLLRSSRVVDFVGKVDRRVVLERLDRRMEKRGRMKRMRWMYYGAASMIILIGLSLFLLLERGPSKVERLAEIHSPAFGATLFTASGEKYNLNNIDDAFVLRTGSGKVIGKDSMSVLSYKGNNGDSGDNGDSGGKSGKSDKSAELKPEVHSVYVPVCGEYRLVLADGTKVWLNADSRLTYPTEFNGDKRVVKLTGEGYFEVERDEKRPFFVRTELADIRVLGTKFNVSAYSGDESVKTTLAEGSVVVSTRDESVRLEPDQQARVGRSGAKIEVREVDAGMYTAWAYGVFEFQAMRMQDIAGQLSRWYGIEFFFVREELKDMKFTGAARRMDSLNDLLKKIEKTTKIKFDIKENSIIVR